MVAVRVPPEVIFHKLSKHFTYKGSVGGLPENLIHSPGCKGWLGIPVIIFERIYENTVGYHAA